MQSVFTRIINQPLFPTVSFRDTFSWGKITNEAVSTTDTTKLKEMSTTLRTLLVINSIICFNRINNNLLDGCLPHKLMSMGCSFQLFDV